MGFTVDIQHLNSEAYEKVMAALKILDRHEVMIGVPDDAESRKDGPISNAELLFIHTNGSPVNGIPPRPVLEPAMKQHKDSVSACLKKGIDAALKGNAAGVMPALEAAGLHGQNISRKYFTEVNGWPANAPQTVERKGSARPLIDTDEMRKSITYVVREV